MNDSCFCYRKSQIMQAFGVAHFNLEFYSVRDTYHQRILQPFTTTNGGTKVPLSKALLKSMWISMQEFFPCCSVIINILYFNEYK